MKNKLIFGLILLSVFVSSLVFANATVSEFPLHENFENWNVNQWVVTTHRNGDWSATDGNGAKNSDNGFNLTVTKYTDDYDAVFLYQNLAQIDSIIVECDFRVPVNFTHFGEAGRLKVITTDDIIGERPIELCILKRDDNVFFNVASYYTDYNGENIMNKTLTSDTWYKLKLECKYVNTTQVQAILLKFWIDNKSYYTMLTGGALLPINQVSFGIHFAGYAYLMQNMVFHYDNIYVTDHEWDYTIFYIFILGFVVIISSCCYFAFQIKNGNFIKGMFFGVSGIAIGFIMIIMWLMV